MSRSSSNKHKRNGARLAKLGWAFCGTSSSGALNLEIAAQGVLEEKYFPGIITVISLIIIWNKVSELFAT